MEQFVTTIALIGIVVVVASLLSGALERSGVPVVAVFLALGAVLGPWGLGIIDIGITSPALHILATLGLTLVLFSDAVTLDTAAVRARRRLALRLLGPGTIVPATVIGFAAWFLLEIHPAAAALIGAALASTDPVLLRSVLRSRAFPPVPRIALRMETGMNDVVLLPVVVISMMVLRSQVPGSGGLGALDIGRHIIGLFLLGPALGALIGWMGIMALGRIRERVGVRRDYESLYAIGLAFSGYAAAEAVGGSGFLAAFAAGFMVALQDIELCDCFMEYGEATAEMLLLLTFVALGTSLIWTGLTVIDGRTILFTAVALFARTVVLLPMLRSSGLTLRDRRLIALFGPRGLSSLLFTLLPVFAGIPGSERLFTVTCLVVLFSVLIHGGGIAIFLRRNSRATLPLAPESVAPAVAGAGVLASEDADANTESERISVEELQELLRRHEPVVILDVRKDRNYNAEPFKGRGSIRIAHEEAVRAVAAERIPRDAMIVAYCACPDDGTSVYVAQLLRQAGWAHARALTGGWDAWKAAGLPVETRPELTDAPALASSTELHLSESISE